MSERGELGGMFARLLLIAINRPGLNLYFELSYAGQKVREIGTKDDRMSKFFKFI